MPGSDIIRSLANGLDVLALVVNAQDGLRVRDVARVAGLKPSVAHNVLRTLTVKGFVKRDAAAPVYRPGPRLYGLLSAREERPSLDRVEASMRRLLDSLPDATVSFAQPVNGEIAVRRRLSSDHCGVIQKPSAFFHAPYSSASGLAVLAFCSEECYLTLQQHHPLLEEGARLWSPPSRLDAYLACVRKQGYALHPSANEKRIAIACPVWNERQDFLGVLGIAQTADSGETFDKASLEDRVAKLRQATQWQIPAVPHT